MLDRTIRKAATLPSRMNRLNVKHIAVLYGWSVLLWFLLALLFAVEGHILSRYRGGAQPWWPSFGYSLAIFSVWAMLTPPLLIGVTRIEERWQGRKLRYVAYLAGLLAANPVHVALFALLYWPFYNNDGEITSRAAMGGRMIMQNLHTNLVFYTAIIALGILLAALARRYGPIEAPTSTATLRVKSRGRIRLIPLSEISWIAAAGNYAEPHTADGPVMTDESLRDLEAMLPADGFRRIHKSTIVRLDVVREVWSLGRGDALLILTGGAELRLSRRYRDQIAPLVTPAVPLVK
jgi:hypothetical protein